MKHGIIDIGSNSVRLSIFADGTVIFRDKITPRLAQGLTAEDGLDKESFNRTVIISLVKYLIFYQLTVRMQVVHSSVKTLIILPLFIPIVVID